MLVKFHFRNWTCEYYYLPILIMTEVVYQSPVQI
jgi:hypothetical protein